MSSTTGNPPAPDGCGKETAPALRRRAEEKLAGLSTAERTARPPQDPLTAGKKGA